MPAVEIVFGEFEIEREHEIVVLKIEVEPLEMGKRLVAVLEIEVRVKLTVLEIGYEKRRILEIETPVLEAVSVLLSIVSELQCEVLVGERGCAAVGAFQHSYQQVLTFVAKLEQLSEHRLLLRSVEFLEVSKAVSREKQVIEWLFSVSSGVFSVVVVRFQNQTALVLFAVAEENEEEPGRFPQIVD